MEIISVIKEPYSSRKNLGAAFKNKFVLTFLVDKNANKIMIKKAFKAVFGVKVKSVNTLIKHPQPARMTQKSRKNFTKTKKLAYISLTREDFLNLRKAIEGELPPQEQDLSSAQKDELKLSGGKEKEKEAIDVNEKFIEKKENNKGKKEKKSKKRESAEQN